jgi:PKD repeat protein
MNKKNTLSENCVCAKDTMHRISMGILIALAILFANQVPVAAQTPDPGLMGTHTVIKAEYNLGDAYFPALPPTFPWTMECRGSVHYPADIATAGPFPVLIWLHGRHSTCYNPSTGAASGVWPCPAGRLPIRSYEGYDYAAQTMASHGYIVISISANSINAHDASSSDDGMTARGHIVQDHLDLWKGWNTTVTTGPFGTTFVGKLDMQNIGTMGHSRGGEGVVYNAEYNRSLGSPYGIKAVLTLAPVDFYRHVLNGIPLMNMAPYCDGDVNDLEGVHFYDDARYKSITDNAPKHNILVMGADHNYFNTVWTNDSSNASGDDWGFGPDAYCDPGASGNGRLDSTKQKAVYNAYAAAFYRVYLGKETQYAPILEVNDIMPPASSLVDSSKIFVSYHAGKTDRLDVNTIDTLPDLTTNTLTGAVTSTALFAPAVCSGGLAMPDCDVVSSGAQKPHNGTSGGTKGLGQMRIKWTDTTGTYQNDVPAGSQDFTYYQNLTFRASVNFTETTIGDYNYFTVELIDSAGSKSDQLVDNYSNALFFQPGSTFGDLPKLVFNTIHLPISGFTGINLAKVRHIKFKFNKSAAGAVLVSDVALSNPICGHTNSYFTDSLPFNVYKVYFKNKSTASVGDTVTYLWKFGNPTSGVNDTSTLQNPAHTYTGAGSYTACLYEKVRRSNGLGMVCNDTFCYTILVPPRTGINDPNAPEITIVPNPARDYLQINGAEKTDVLKLVNMYGQEVFSTTIAQPVINLPQTLPAGMYFAVVLSPRGNVYQKILIYR